MPRRDDPMPLRDDPMPVRDDLVPRLRDDLLRAGYRTDAVEDRLGPVALRALQRNSTLAASRALGDDRDALATMIRLFVLARPVPVTDAANAFGDVDGLREAGILRPDPQGIRADVEIRPYAIQDAGGDWDGWLVNDLNPTLDGATATPRDDFVLGASPASTTLAQITPGAPVGTALDLGTGCGIQSLHLARHARRIVATDLNPRALHLARLTLALSAVQTDLRLGDLYTPVAGHRFDLVVSNPPYVMSPPETSRLTYREGSHRADGLMRAVVEKGRGHLAEGGTLQVLGNWAVAAGESPADRLAGWTSGASAVVVERERLDPYEYAELWLADAGLGGTPGYRAAYDRWIDYFAAERIESVAMGWVSVVRNGREDFSYLEWPHEVVQPVGDALAAVPVALANAARPDVDLLATHWTLAPFVVQETLGAPGAPDPQHIVLRQRSGLCRAVEVDTALAAVVGACDGDLPLGRLISAVAGLLDVSGDGLVGDLLPRVRTIVEQGFLVAGR